MKKLIITLAAGLFAVTTCPAQQNKELENSVNWYEYNYIENRGYVIVENLKHEVAEKTVNSSDYAKFGHKIPDNTPMTAVKFSYTESERRGYKTWNVTKVVFVYQDVFNKWHLWEPPIAAGLETDVLVKDTTPPPAPESYIQTPIVPTYRKGDATVSTLEQKSTPTPRPTQTVPRARPVKSPQ
jgi:hypothetical protein